MICRVPHHSILWRPTHLPHWFQRRHRSGGCTGLDQYLKAQTSRCRVCTGTSWWNNTPVWRPRLNRQGGHWFFNIFSLFLLLEPVAINVNGWYCIIYELTQTAKGQTETFKSFRFSRLILRTKEKTTSRENNVMVGYRALPASAVSLLMVTGWDELLQSQKLENLNTFLCRCHLQTQW